MSELHPSLRENVRLLGGLLGENVKEQYGDELFDLVESVRHAAKADREVPIGDASEELVSLLSNLQDDQLVPLSRAFNQFLNLANIAEQYHGVRRSKSDSEDGVELFDELLQRLKASNVSKQQMQDLVNELSIEFVLTADRKSVV